MVKDFHGTKSYLCVPAPNLAMVWATTASRACALHAHKVSWAQPVFLTCVAQSIQQLCLQLLELHVDLVQPEGEFLWRALCWSNRQLRLQKAGTHTWQNLLV